MGDQKISSVAVLCSGGDAPGMNAAIRSVVRSALGNNIKPYGIYRGYSGLLAGEIIPMDAASVGNTLQKGGTILQTSRCPEFLLETSRQEAANILKRKRIDSLVVIGGDGSFNGAYQMFQETKFPIVGIPGTIDNDISGTEYTIGFDTAVNTAMEAVDRIRDTASSHARTFIVEVMGRRSPQIAIHVAVATGAENVVFPEKDINYQDLIEGINRGIARGKTSSILIMAEGDRPGMSYEVQKILKEKFNLEAHVCILGHVQRGGSPTHRDRFIAGQMGELAIEALIQKKYPSVTVYNNGHVGLAELAQCLKKRNEVDTKSLLLAQHLSI